MSVYRMISITVSFYKNLMGSGPIKFLYTNQFLKLLAEEDSSTD